MSDIEEQAAERVAKAKRINDEVLKRLHQNDVQPGVKPARATRAKAKDE